MSVAFRQCMRFMFSVSCRWGSFHSQRRCVPLGDGTNRCVAQSRDQSVQEFLAIVLRAKIVRVVPAVGNAQRIGALVFVRHANWIHAVRRWELLLFTTFEVLRTPCGLMCASVPWHTNWLIASPMPRTLPINFHHPTV